MKISLTSLIIIGFFGFCLLDTSVQDKIVNKVGTLVSSIQTSSSNQGSSSDTNGGGESKDEKVRSQEVLDYYDEVVMNGEFSGRRESEYKWTTDMKIYVEGEPTLELLSELERVVSELNDIINPIDLIIVNDRNKANMFVYFGSPDGFKNAHPNIDRSRLNRNWGYFDVGINEGEMYVDIYRANDEEQKHLLREELTQSLGLFNDSHKYPESIFYQEWTTTTEFAPIDRELIDMLYN